MTVFKLMHAQTVSYYALEDVCLSVRALINVHSPLIIELLDFCSSFRCSACVIIQIYLRPWRYLRRMIPSLLNITKLSPVLTWSSFLRRSVPSMGLSERYRLADSDIELGRCDGADYIMSPRNL